jgi:uncharacterized membrane protein YidH (DUF202 family)
MCIFCAAIPAVAAVGTAAHGQQREAARKAEREGRPAPKPKVPPAKAAGVLVVALVIASVVYHTHLPV